jgi:hypothetical protein
MYIPLRGHGHGSTRGRGHLAVGRGCWFRRLGRRRGSGRGQFRRRGCKLRLWRMRCRCRRIPAGGVSHRRGERGPDVPDLLCRGFARRLKPRSAHPLSRSSSLQSEARNSRDPIPYSDTRQGNPLPSYRRSVVKGTNPRAGGRDASTLRWRLPVGWRQLEGFRSDGDRTSVGV